jgi:hypothetical protein
VVLPERTTLRTVVRDTRKSREICRFRRKPATYSDLIAATIPI